MKRTYSSSLILLAVLLTGAIAAAQLDGIAGLNEYDLSWHTIDGGGGTSTGSGYRLDGTIGQPDAGAMTGGSPGNEYVLTGGYWAGAAAGDVPVPTCPGDLTNSSGTGTDGVVNGFDLLKMLSCWGPVLPGCEDADLTNSSGTGTDSVVNGFDLLALLSNWGPCPR